MSQMTQKSKKQLKIEIVKKVEKMTLPHSYRRMAGILVYILCAPFLCTCSGSLSVRKGFMASVLESAGSYECFLQLMLPTKPKAGNQQ